MKLLFLGTSGGESYPGVWCACPNCAYARAHGGRNLRMNTGTMIDDDILLDLNSCGFHTAARLGVSWQDAKILSAHGRALSESALCHAVRTHRQTFCFLDAAHNPAWVRESLNLGGLENVRLFVGERLSYPDERTEAYDPDATYDPLCMAYIENDAPESGLPPVGLSDEAFIRGKTPMTKRDVRALVVSALHLKPNGVVWDIGAGTGSVSVECARQCPLGEVYAVEMKDEALDLIRRNAERFHALNLRVVPGRALEVLSALPAPDAVFLGGTTGEAEAIVELLRGLQRPIRLVATAVTMESAQALLHLMRPMVDFEARQVAVSALESVGRYTMFKAENPVFIFSANVT